MPIGVERGSQDQNDKFDEESLQLMGKTLQRLPAQDGKGKRSTHHSEWLAQESLDLTGPLDGKFVCF